MLDHAGLVSTSRRRGPGRASQVIESWPKAATTAGWFNAEGDRLVICWNLRVVGDEWPDTVPLLLGVSAFEFRQGSLNERYEAFFDTDCMTPHAA